MKAYFFHAKAEVRRIERPRQPTHPSCHPPLGDGVDPQPVVQRHPRRTALRPRLRARYIVGLARGGCDHDAPLGAPGRHRGLVQEVALWAFPAGLIGGRLYFLATSWNEVPDHWWGPFALWRGGLGIWGGIAAGTLAGLLVLRRRGADVARFLDAAAPGAARRAGDRPRSATTSTRSSSAGPPASRGASRSILRTAPRGYAAVRHLPSDVPLRADLEPRARRLPRLARAPRRSVRPGCSRSTSPATRAFASSRSCCASTPPTTSSACG